MRKPSKNLDDYIVKPDPGVTPNPPRAVSLLRSGEVEILRPLTRSEVQANPSRVAFKTFRPPQPLWFRRFLAVGSGALVMIALVLVTAILVGINDPAAGLEVVTSVTPHDGPTQPAEPFIFDIPSPSSLAPATVGVDIVRSNPRRRRARPTIHIAAAKPRHQTRPLPESEEPKFVPTTLVIYAENGVIYSRIEPWLHDSN